MNYDHSVPDFLTSALMDWSRSNPTHIPRLACFHKLLKAYVEKRGCTHVLSIIFPSIGKAFDSALSSGAFKPVDVAFGNTPFAYKKRGKSGGIEPLLELFFYSADNGQFLLRSDTCPNDVFFMRTVLNMYKKVKLECSTETKQNDINNFFEVDKTLPIRDPEFSALLRSISRFYVPLKLPDYSVPVNAGYDSRHFRKTGELGWKPRHGPGATVDTCSARDKYFALRNFPASLHVHFPPDLYATHKETVGIHVGREEIPAKVVTVAKTLDKTRVITVESTANQFCQQAVRNWILTHCTKHYRMSIDISRQDLSMGAAKEASIDGSTATVDLKSASDFLSQETVSTIFGVNAALLDAMMASRSKTVIKPCGMPVVLNKYAGQGNATTFVTQSICYTVICVAAFLLTHNLEVSSKNCAKASKVIRVYGDDIILPSSCMLYLSRILQCEGLRINADKTHTNGFFREACGGDYFRGFDVTPLYVPSIYGTFQGDAKEEPELLQSLCEVSNNAYKKGLWACCKSIRDILPSYVHTYGYPGSLGFYSHLPYQRGIITRWNGDLQVHETLIYSVKSVKRFKESEAIYGRLYKYFIEKPSQDDNWEGRLTVKNTLAVRPVWSEIYLSEV